MNMIKLNQQLKRVEVKEFEIENEIVFTYFNQLPSKERDKALLKAIYIGVLALMEDRISAFLSKTSNELGTELESLKMMFEMKREIFFKSSLKGVLAETDIAEFLVNYLKDKNIQDQIKLMGNSIGFINRNKTGDIVCEIAGHEDLRIVLECKFDKNIRLGEIETKDMTVRKNDTAWSQLIESQANRRAKIGILVMDISLTDSSILKKVDSVSYIQGVGLIAIIDAQKGDYTNLAIAYMLARDIAINSKEVNLDTQTLSMIINRIIKDIQDVLSIRNLVNNNISNNINILKMLEKSLLCIEFNQFYLQKFLEDGQLSKEDLLSFYQRDNNSR